jgi:subtilisin
MLRISLLFVILAISQIAQAQTPGPNDTKYVVTFQAGTSQTQRAAAVQRAGGLVRFNFSIVDAVAITAPNANALTALRNDRSVLSIARDLPVYASQNANGVGANAKPGSGGTVTPGQVVPEGVKRVGVPVASTSDGTGIGVAILDTGIDLAHIDLAANIHPDTFASPSFGTTCQDDNGHGTHVAGIVGALDNDTGTIGVAPKATLYCVKVLDSSGNGSDSDVIAGLDWVWNRASIRVVNMSLGRDASPDPLDDKPMQDAIKKLYDAGVTVVVAAGNDATKEVKNMVPAGFKEVLSVASTTAKDGTNSCRRLSGKIFADTASYFTTDGARELDLSGNWLRGVTISAPGADAENVSNGCMISSVGILSAKLGGGTTRMSGTSMASPHVAGVAARFIQQNPAWTPENIRTQLRNTAQNTGTAPLNSPTSSYTFDGDREGVAKAP